MKPTSVEAALAKITEYGFTEIVVEWWPHRVVLSARPVDGGKPQEIGDAATLAGALANAVHTASLSGEPT